MEDFPKKTEDNKDTDAEAPKKRRFPDFWESFQRRYYPELVQYKSKADKSDKEEGDSKEKQSLGNRLVKKFKNFLKNRGVLEVEKISATSTGAEKAQAELEVPVESQPWILHRPEIEKPAVTEYGGVVMYKRSDEVALPEIPEELIRPTMAVGETREPLANTQEIAEEASEPITTVEKDTFILKQVKQETSLAAERQVETVDTLITEQDPAKRAREALRLQYEARLRREVRKLKKRAKDLETEQKEVKKQQETFSRQLEKQQRSYEKFNKITIPKMEQSRRQLHTRIENEPKAAERIEENTRIEQQNQVSSRLEQKTELLSPELKTIIQKETTVRPEIVLKTVEQAAEQNVPIEGLYERRHEIKDEAPEDALPVKASMGSIHRRNNSRQLLGQTNVATQLRPTTGHNQTTGYPTSVSSQLDMYKQAMKSGFWAAIALLILIGVLAVTL